MHSAGKMSYFPMWRGD